MKVMLETKHIANDDRYLYLNWRSCLPFLLNTRGYLIHRPRAIATVSKSAISKYPYLISSMWCGLTLCGGETWTFLEMPPENGIVFSRCEALALLNGFTSSSSLAGKHIHIGGVKAVATCCDVEPTTPNKGE